MQPESLERSRSQKLSPAEQLRLLEPDPGWSLLTAAFFVLAYAVLFMVGQILVATLSGSAFDAPTPDILALGALLGGLVTIGGIGIWARQRLSGQWIDRLRLRASLNPPIFIAVLAGLGAAWAIDLVGVLLNLKGNQVLPVVLDVLRNPIGLTWIATALLALIVQPVAEGLVFAGILYPALAHRLKNNLAAVLAAALIDLLISAAVIATGGGVWYALIQPFLMALVMLLMRAYAHSTQSAIVTRALFGLFFILAGLINMRFS